MGEAVSTDPLKAAQEALRKAEAEYQAAQRTSDALGAEAADVEKRLQWARIGRDDAVRAVPKAAPEVQRLLDDLKVAQCTVDEIAGKLNVVSGVLPPSWIYYATRPDPQAGAIWNAALEALHADADAPLPQS